MITPTARAIVLVALGALAALVLAGAAPQAWIFGAAWPLAALALIIADAMLAGAGSRLTARLEAPRAAGVSAGAFTARVALASRETARAIEVVLEASPLVAVSPSRVVARLDRGQGGAEFTIAPQRRGDARFMRAYLRWRGPLGLAWRQRIAALDAATALTPDLGAVERLAERLFSRSAVHGQKPLRDRGDGSEFDALAKFETGMDPRLIDWKQSARHTMLLAKEVRAERNHQLAFAIDTGRAMCEPVLGAPRVDWALNAALALSYVALKLGDRVGMYGFDARPNLASGFTAGPRAFEQLKLLSAEIDYSSAETNHTFGLAMLAERLQRRSMVVVFTDFSDATGAEFMVSALARLARKHVVVFVVFADEELESLIHEPPHTPEDVSRAVVAARLLRERKLVITRLRRLGVEIVAAPVDRLGEALVAAYDKLRRHERV